MLQTHTLRIFEIPPGSWQLETDATIGEKKRIEAVNPQPPTNQTPRKGPS